MIELLTILELREGEMHLWQSLGRVSSLLGYQYRRLKAKIGYEYVASVGIFFGLSDNKDSRAYSDMVNR